MLEDEGGKLSKKKWLEAIAATLRMLRRSWGKAFHDAGCFGQADVAPSVWQRLSVVPTSLPLGCPSDSALALTMPRAAYRVSSPAVRGQTTGVVYAPAAPRRRLPVKTRL